MAVKLKTQCSAGCYAKTVCFEKEFEVDMTSPSPVLYDTYYHIYKRGGNREDIFVEEQNHDLFLRLYKKYLSPVTDLFAYCLLRNHLQARNKKDPIGSPTNGHHKRRVIQLVEV